MRRLLSTRRWPSLILFALLAVVTMTGGLDWLERGLIDLRYLLVQRDATDRLVVVEIDDRSLRALNVWPWPRRFYAEAIARLIDAGVETVAIDVDFSAHSRPEDDEALERALERAGRRVILPAFKQRPATHADTPRISETKPLERFARYVTLGSVNIQLAPDSLIRTMDSIHELADSTVPAIHLLLGAEGRPAPASFYIDHGIRMATIPRISFVDVLRGEFPPGLFRGRQVLIGATAVELGDQLAVPLHISAPGTIVLALAADSLRQGRALLRIGEGPALALALVLLLLLTPPMTRWPWPYTVGGALAASSGVAGLTVIIQAIAPVSVDAAPALLAPCLACLCGLVAAIERQTMRIFQQRMEMHQRDKAMRLIVENSFDAILVTDHTGRVTMHNLAAERMFGQPAEALHKRPVGSLFRLSAATHDAPSQLAAILAQEDSPACLFAGEATTQDGVNVPVELSVRRMVLHPTNSPLERRKEARSYHFITARDISERQRKDIALRDALQAAESASHAKSQFLATMSHELRTPLNAIIGFSDILKEQLLGPLGNPKYTEYAGDIHESGRHLLELINDILDLSRVDMGEMKFEPTTMDLAECAEAVERLLAGPLEMKSIALQYDIPADLPSLVADPRLVRQILVNLLSNAVKFTPEQGRITVAATRRIDGGITVNVSDTGIGISRDAIPKLGTAFYQVDQSHTRQSGGAGLGLSIVVGLMKLHGGSFAVDSEVGKGTTVSCHFPPECTGTNTRAAA